MRVAAIPPERWLLLAAALLLGVLLGVLLGLLLPAARGWLVAVSLVSAAATALLAMAGHARRQRGERTAELQRTQRKLQALLDAVPSMIGYWDRDLRNQFANHAYLNWFGLEPGSLAGRTLAEVLGPTLFAQNLPFAQAALRGEPQRFERAIPMPDGSGVRHSLAHYIPDVVDGQVLGFAVLVTDVSALKASELRLADALRENQILLTALKAHAPYSMTDEQGSIIDVNDNFCRVSGYDRAALIGRNHRLLGSGAHDAAFWAAMWQRIQSGQPWQGEVCNRHRDGALYWVDTVIAPLPAGQGVAQRYLALRHDITASKRAEQAAQQAVQAAQAANEAKSAFLANMSHEIRTPLNAMIGLTYLLDKGRLDVEQRGFVGKIQFASQALLGVVNDVLDLAKIEAGELQVEATTFDLGGLVDGVAALYGDQAQARGLAFRLSQPADLPRHVVGDPGRLRQVLSNLLANAVKFTERGSVALVLLPLQRDAQRLSLRFEVHDTGIGIAPEAQDRIFQPFAQADGSTTRRFGGTGLGLSIVRELTRLLGGELSLQSKPGEGSVFRVTLPLQIADKSLWAAGAGRRRLNLALHLLRGGANLALLLQAQAQSLGWTTQTTAAREPVPDWLLRLTDSGLQPDAVLSDTELPPAGNAAAMPRPAVVWLGTAPGGVPAASDNGLTAPVDAAALFNAVNQACVREGSALDRVLSATRLEGAGLIWLPGVRVLVVDDSEINREVAARILGREGAAIHSCGSAAEALALLRHAPDDFDLVLMDVQMPDMDGNEATRRIRKELGLARLPVLALTAGALLAERQRTLDAGMDDFISKPIDPDGLIRSVRRHVERVRGTPLPVRQHASAPAQGQRRAWPAIEGVDTDDAAKRLGHDLGLFRRLLQRLLDEFEDLLAETAPVPRKEAACAALATRAHKLCGCAGMLGAGHVQRLAGELQTRLRTPAPTTGTPPLPVLLGELGAALRRLREASAAVRALPAEPAATVTTQPLTPATRAELLAQLRGQDLSAREHFEALAEGLRAALGPARVDAARDAIDNLRFGQAVALLEDPP